MIPELTALESVLADIFREVSTAARLADMAGLDVIQIDRTGSSADVWHSIVNMAIQDGALGALIERARTERPRNKELPTAYEAFQAAQPPAQTKRERPPRGQDGAHLSDYRMDARIDQMQRDMADMRVQVAGLVAQVTTLTEMVRTMTGENFESHGLSTKQFAAILIVIALMTAIVFGIVYYGGNR